jgi:hypothetical protein
MSEPLLLCTDLDRTLIPNGPQPESPAARPLFQSLVAHAEVTLVYVSGRDRGLIEKAIEQYRLPFPDFVIGDVGSSIYRLDAGHDWHTDHDWEKVIGQDWGECRHSDLAARLADLGELRLQEQEKQNRYKLSYYLPVSANTRQLAGRIMKRLQLDGVRARLIWSIDAPARIGLLDVLPERVSKYHAIESLMQSQKLTTANTVFCGDSGNDLEVLVSPIPAVLVANAEPEVRRMAEIGAKKAGHAEKLYCASGGFMGMNGNYAAGILEGVAHYHPQSIDWMVVHNGHDGQGQRSGTAAKLPDGPAEGVK